jgi:hypothetical protein
VITRTIVIFIFTLLAAPGFCQQPDSTRHRVKSSLYLFLGMLPIYVSAMGNYEVMFTHRPNSFFNTSGVRVGGGLMAFWESSGWFTMATYTSLTGKGSNHLEVGLGAVYTDEEAESFFLPAANVGYRYQKPKGRLIFRTGLGVPEAIYVSLGFSFN